MHVQHISSHINYCLGTQLDGRIKPNSLPVLPTSSQASLQTLRNGADTLESKLGAAEGAKAMLEREQGALKQTVTDLQRQVG